MQQNPAIIIINSLNKKKAEIVKARLETESRTSLLKLFEILYSKRDSSIDKKDLFKKLYGYNYSDDKDYLLRNELRILRQKLDDIIIKMAIETEVKSNINYRNKMRLFAYRQFGLNELFADEYDGAVDSANSNLDFEKVLSMQQWIMELGYNHKLNHLKSYEEKAIFFKTLSENCTGTLEEFSATILRMSQYYYSLAGYYQQLAGKGSLFNILEEDYQLKIKDHPLSLHFHYRSLAIHTNGKERLMNFIKSFEMLENHNPQNDYIIELELNSLLNISRSLQQTRDYEAAMNYIAKAFNDYLPKLDNYASEEKLYANYLIALMNMFEYEKAISILNSLQEKNKGEQYINNWFNIYQIMGNIGMKDMKMVSKLMPVNFNNIPPQHRVYYRLLLCIELHLLNREDQACREFQNLTNSKLNDEYGKDVEYVIGLFGFAFVLFEKYQGQKNVLSEKELIKLNMLTEQVENNILNDINILPLYRWIRRELELKFKLQQD